MASRLQEIRNIRIEKLNKLIALGLSGYPAHSSKSVANGQIVSNFDKFENQEVTLTGRLMALRQHGKLIFGDLEDASGRLQIFIKDGELKPTDSQTNTLGFADLNLLDVGDFVQVDGKIIKTKTGAISIAAQSIHLLTKSLRPLPDSWNGIDDKDLMFRRRYLDLTLNADRRAMFMRKSKFWSVSRKFMLDHGFVEVETPVLEHVTGGADAKPFVTHHDALDETFYMRISTELYLKRLIGGGYEKIFTLAPNFRNEGIDDEHLQEYYQLEWYWAYADYRDNMAFTRDLLRQIAQDVYGKTVFTRGKHTFDLAADWPEIDFGQVIKERLGIDIYVDSEDKMLAVLKENKIKLDPGSGKGRIIDNLWKLIRKTIAGPAFLINEPKFMSPLAKSKPEDDRLTERFHVIIAGSELGNGYSELNDPQDQLARFLEQQSARDSGDDESQMLDIDFVEMLEYGMPPTSGVGISERVFWFLEGVTAREGTLFPQMKRHIEPLTREIYGLKEE